MVEKQDGSPAFTSPNLTHYLKPSEKVHKNLEVPDHKFHIKTS